MGAVDHQTGSPWPLNVDQPVLFILDAANSSEEQILANWVKTNAPENIKFSTVVVPICVDPESIPTEKLEAELKQVDKVLICPLRVVWKTAVDAKDTAPRFRDLIFANSKRPSKLRARRILRMNPDNAICIAAQPATFNELKQKLSSQRSEVTTSECVSDFVASQASLALDIAERRLTGNRYKVPRRVAMSLKARAKFQQALQDIGKHNNRPEAELHKETNKIMKELIAIPQTFWLDVMAYFNRYMTNLGYETEMVIDQNKLADIRQITKEKPSVLLWTHKTHVDGFAIHSVLLENDFPAPHILGGVNMAFGGLGYMARRAGAIFIRRSFQDNALYKTILQYYIAYLLEKRFPLTWAFEGTRSRVGKLMPPRYGLLKYVLSAAHLDKAENLHIIPVALNYDLIGDVSDYASEQAGKTKTPESLSWFIKYLRGLKQPMGRIYVDIGRPVKLSQVPDPSDPLVLQKIAFQVGVEVNKVTPITLAALVSMILLGVSPRALTRDEIQHEMSKYLHWAEERDVPVTSSAKLENEEQLLNIAEVLIKSGLLTRFSGGPEDVYFIAQENHGVASYYRNTSIHHFVNKAIAELSLVYVSGLDSNCTYEFWQEAEKLRDMFKFEFFYAPIDEFRDQIRDELNRYDIHWEIKLDNDAHFAKSFLETLIPLTAHSALLTFIEAYRVVADVLAGKSSKDEIQKKEFIDECMAYGKQAVLQQRISSQASVGKLLFQNGWKLMENLTLLAATEEVESRRLETSQYLKELKYRVDILRAISFPR